jgi:hypothetical protein
MASLYDSASLVMIPSGVKDGKAYSIKPTDGSGDFTFSRGTGTATRVNASGLIEKERSNQLLHSNDFSNAAWGKSGVTLTGGQADKDGGTNAWLLESVSTSAVSVNQAQSAQGVKTISFYAKAGTQNWMRVSFNDSGLNSRAWFDLTNGVVGTTTGNVIEAKMTSVGSGWYRLQLAVNINSAYTGVFFFVTNGDNTVSTTAGDNVYIQDAQLEQGLVATDYIETTTAAVYEGITDNLPRLDYSGGASCPSLLLEPSRTNLFQQSEYFGDSSWSLSEATATLGSTSPEGKANAYTFTTTSATNPYIRAQPLAGGTTYIHGVFAKYNNSQYIYVGGLGRNANENEGYVSFDIQNGVKGQVIVGPHNDFDIIDFGNGWYYCWVSRTYSGTQLNVEHRFGVTDSPSSLTFSVGKSVEIYGAKLEAGSYPTSYIPTYGTAASRAGDGLNKTGISDLIGQTEGVLFLDYVYGHNQVSAELFSISDGSVANRIYVGEIGNTFITLVRKDSITQFNPSGLTPVIGQRYKLAVAYAENDFAFYVNGTQIATSSSGSVPATSQVRNDSGAGSSNFYQNINQVLLFKTRLTNAELAALTTL